MQVKYKELDVKIDKTHDSLQMKFNNNQIKFESQVEELQSLINTNNECINDINTQISKIKSELHMNDFQDLKHISKLEVLKSLDKNILDKDL